MKNFPLPRLDLREDVRLGLEKHCRLNRGGIWNDPVAGHRVGCLDAADPEAARSLTAGNRAVLAIQDPPYNVAASRRMDVSEYVAWCSKWVENTASALAADSALYVWLGADQADGFQPLPDFMLMMRRSGFRSRSFITMRNQRGYGTQKNWMAVRQELLCYVKGNPRFNVEAEYTDIPKILRGYYKEIKGRRMENVERGRAPTIRAGNVWVDLQQVFYRMEENVNGCYAQKPLAACERIVKAASSPGDLVLDFFCHSGSTLLACERTVRRCFTMDIDPVFCETAIRRLEMFRSTGRTGWQNGNPFEDEIEADPELRRLVHPFTKVSNCDRG